MLLQTFTLKIIVVGLCALAQKSDGTGDLHVLCVDAGREESHGRMQHEPFICFSDSELKLDTTKPFPGEEQTGSCFDDLPGNKCYSFNRQIHFNSFGSGQVNYPCKNPCVDMPDTTDCPGCPDPAAKQRSIFWIPEMKNFYLNPEELSVVGDATDGYFTNDDTNIWFRFAGAKVTSGRRYSQDDPMYDVVWRLASSQYQSVHTQKMADEVVLEYVFPEHPGAVVFTGDDQYENDINISWTVPDTVSAATIVLGSLPAMDHDHGGFSKELAHYRWFYHLIQSPPYSTPGRWPVPVAVSLPIVAVTNEFCPLVRLDLP